MTGSKPNDVTSAATNTVTVRIRPWVRWWFFIGVICGAVALANIIFRDLTRLQERIILLLGVVHWVLGGLVCWAWQGIRFTKPTPQEVMTLTAADTQHEPRATVESHYFTLSGSDRARLRISHRRELLDDYLLRRWERQHPSSLAGKREPSASDVVRQDERSHN